jgi:ABC-type sugar transport system ATPase subunit
VRVWLDRVSKTFGHVVAVEEVSLRINDGELVALLGPSGCGKSTTLFLMAGLYRPSAGRISFDDRIVNDVSPQARGVGMVFQSYALYPHLSVFENIAFPLRVQRVPREDVTRRVREVADLTGIAECLPRRPGQLSGGQQQRVALCRALVKAPSILLLDEPLSNLDARLREATRAEIKRLQQHLGITTVFVSHDQAEALGIADRVGVMHRGRLMALMTPADLYRRPPSRFIAEFVGTPPMNFLPVQVSDNTVLLNGMPLGRLPRPVPAGAYVLGVRPEHAHVAADGTVRAQVVLVEPMGRECLVHATCGDVRLRILADPETPFRVDEWVGLRLDWKRVHLFEAESGRAVPAVVENGDR